MQSSIWFWHNFFISEEELLLEKDSCFDDASKYFKKLHHVKERLDKWKLDYPKEYEQGYGAMSMAGIFDIYVRHELLDWSPFTVFAYSTLLFFW